MKNSVFSLPEKQLLPFSPEYFLTSNLTCTYDERTECHTFLKFIDKFCEHHKERTAFIQAWLSAVLHSRVELQVFLYLQGPGGTGKSQQLALIATALVGKEATITTTLKSLHSDQFELAALIGKKLVFVSDTEHYKADMSVLKALVGNHGTEGKSQTRPKFV